MNSKPQDPELSPRPAEASTPQHDNVGDMQEELESVLDAFRRLVQAAADTGRDWKLVDALLRTTIELALRPQEELFVSTVATQEASSTKEATPSGAKTVDAPQLRLRPEHRLRIESIIDSWSDDETADFLMIGPRQVQRRARQGKLYYFLVHGKRRFPVWQFDRACSVLVGAASVGHALPESWSAGRVYEFMTTRSPNLKLVTPAQWLLMKRDPASILAAIPDTWEPL